MEIYKPTQAEILKIKPQLDMLKVSGDGSFATLQGEGATSGLPAVFLRLHFCNLACGKISGWQCDTGYTWDQSRKEFWQESEDWKYDEAAKSINQKWEEKFGEATPLIDKRLVVTGGEPFIQQKKIVDLLKFLPGWKVEIETNGTVTPAQEFHDHQINCSPKLSNSGNSLIKRFKPEVLKAINSFPNSWFKFVVSSPTDLSEIDEIVGTCNLNPKKILAMPEGHTVESTEAHYNMVENEVLKRGWQMTKRNQLQWFGDKRRT